jgi:hypothetical protein
VCGRRRDGAGKARDTSTRPLDDDARERRRAMASSTTTSATTTRRATRDATTTRRATTRRAAAVRTPSGRRRVETRAGEDEWGAKPWDDARDGADPLSNEVLLSIVRSELADEEVNRLVWNALGYRSRVELDAETLTANEVWTPDEVFPNWAKNYPEPPDVIGVTRKYDPKIDAPVKAACAALTRSVPEEHKQGIKTTLTPLGWKGFKMEGLTPNMTRRAQVANWLLFYRRELRGVSIEELRARRDARKAKEIAEGKQDRPTGTTKQGVV